MAGQSLHGVNLTGWLTLESWVTPELFAEAGALDEEALAKSFGERRYRDYVRNHRAAFIARDDFARIASRGMNAVRLPVPWYVFGDEGPEPGPYLGCVDEVDRALDWAEEIGLKVVFVLALNLGGPSSGSGLAPDNADLHVARQELLDVIARLSRRYRQRAGFFGLELADDVVPQLRRGLFLSDGVPVHRLRNYYREAYEIVREEAGHEPVVILPDGGAPSLLDRFMAQSHYENVWVDVHLDRPSVRVDVSGPAGVRSLVEDARRRVQRAKRCGQPVMVGKWSASLPVADAQMTPEGRVALERVYTSEQLGIFEKRPAWFFNTWKTTGMLGGWDARVALATFERGMIV